MKTYFTNVLLIDGNGGQPIENACILVEDKIIKSISKTDETKFCTDSNIVNYQGKTIMPGMINCHLHFIMEPYAWNSYNTIIKESETNICLRGLNNLKNILKSGVTFFRDCGGYKNIDIDIRDAKNEEKIIGPDFLVSGSPLCITGGHTWWFGRECDGKDEFLKGTREQVRSGADLIKIMATGGYARPKMKMNHNIMPDSPQITLKEASVVVEEAHKFGKKVAAHCLGITGAEIAVQAGVDSLEHGQFHDVDDERVDKVLELMAKNGTYLVPTLSAYFKNYNKSEVIDKYKSVTDSLIKASKAGVKIAMGNDSGCPFVGHETSSMELKHMVEAGIKPMDAIMSATKNAADLLGISSSYGTLEEGKYADFLVLNDNPINNIETLLEIDHVYKGGNIV